MGADEQQDCRFYCHEIHVYYVLLEKLDLLRL